MDRNRAWRLVGGAVLAVMLALLFPLLELHLFPFSRLESGLFPLGLLALMGLLVAVAVVLPVSLLWYFLGARRVLFQLAAWFLVALGAVPPSVFAVLQYAARADYVWAIRGPSPFNQLGSSPFWLWAFLTTAGVTALCWGAALWFMVVVHSLGHSLGVEGSRRQADSPGRP